MAAACAACHIDIQAQLNSRKGLHGSLQKPLTRACGACHVEHSGAQIKLVGSRSFHAAGFDETDKFDHSKIVRFDLIGRHAELKCDQCHKNALASKLPEGQKRFLGLKQQCMTCHKDPHEGTFGDACASCHGQSLEFKKADGFTHTGKFPLDGGHANLTCAKCHDKSGPQSVAVLHAPGQRLVVRACAACHDDVHEGTFGQDCASCHGTVRPFKLAPLFKHTPDFPLAGGHAGVGCNKCHADAGVTSVAALQIEHAPIRACGECHQSPHSTSLVGQVASLERRSELETCATCHQSADKTFLSPIADMTPQFHRFTGFALDAPHDKLQCAQCHAQIGKREPLKPGPQLSARFAALYPGRAADACEKCHADAHRGQFANTLSRGRCVVCHSTLRFTPTTFDLARHEKTDFPLTGGHKAASCVLCHKKIDGIARFVPTATACSSCHADVHAGRFDAKGMSSVVQGRDGCARCHSTGSFGRVAWTADDHGKWTDYPLKGRHATAACADCHKPQARPDEHNRVFGVAPKSCNACHADPHAGQFMRQNATDCARCHTDTGKFTATTFDHQKDSSFKLDALHVGLACSACHRPYELAGGAKVVRFRPLGTRCEDCHDSRTLRGAEAR